MTQNPLPPADLRESGDPGVFRHCGTVGDGEGRARPKTQEAWAPAFARLSGLLAALVPASAAFAHEGHHEGMSASVGLHHLLTEPDHLAMLGLFAILVASAGWRVYRSRAAR